MTASRPNTHRALQDNPGARAVDRRLLLRFSLAGAAGLILSPRALPAWARRSQARNPGKWSDPRTWGGSIPGPRDVAVISSAVVIDDDARVAGVIIEPGAALSFLSGRSVTLESTGNVVVRGRLSMRPNARSSLHRLVFTNVNEGRYVGRGKRVLNSDVGLWVMGSGVLSTAGSQKLAWTRTASGVPRGATTVELQDAPEGWQVGDTIVLTPTRSPANPRFNTAYDSAEIKTIRGRTVTLSRPTKSAHPAVEVKRGSRFTPEVLNLTRNVRIEGTRRGRAHVFIHSRRGQRVEHTLISHMGPRQRYEGGTVGVRGRYPLHFHECGGGSRGSWVRGTVVAASGNHAFVPHSSNGITFVDCISHDSVGDAYWWDPMDEQSRMIHFSHAIVWNRCVASLVRDDPKQTDLRMSGFTLGAGDRNIVRNCVAAGVNGGAQSSGFHWRTEGAETKPWGFANNVAHNNVSNGSFNWQNDEHIGTARGFVAYHNGGAGISQGAYKNPYRFKDAILYGNALAAVKLHAVSRHVPLRFSDSTFDGAGLSNYLVVTEDHRFPAGVPTEFVRCVFKGYRHAAIRVAADRNGGGVPNWIELVNCSYEGTEFWVDSNAAPDTRLMVRDRARGELTVKRWDRPGVPRREWNASSTPGRR
jgi:hypothetical protein